VIRPQSLISVVVTSGRSFKGLKTKPFSPDNKVSVKFTDDSGTSEGAVDLGGPKREFFTLVLEWIVNSQLFCGTEKSNNF